MTRFSSTPLLAALSVVLVQSVVALSRVDELELERYSANVAWALLHGLPLDPEQLPIISHLRGSFLFGLALVPIIALVGPQLLALKILAVAVSALTAALAAALARDHLGRVGTFAVVALFVAAPPAYQMVDVLALGSHVDTVPFLLLPLLLVLRLPHDRPARLAAVAAFGASAGFAVLFSYQALVALPAWLLVYALRQPPSRASLGRATVGLVAFAVCAAPIVWLSRDAKLANHDVLGGSHEFAIGEVAQKFGAALVHDLPASWGYGVQGLGFVATLIAWCALAGWMSVLVVAPHTRALWRSDGARQLLAAGALHVLALLVGYGFVELEADLTANEDGMAGRYFLPLWPAFAFAIGGGCAALARRGAPRVAAALAIALAALSASATLRFLEPAKAFTQPTVSALEFHAFRDHVAHASKDAAEQLEWLQRLEPSWQAWWPFHQLVGAFEFAKGPGALRDRLEDLRRTSPQLLPYRCATVGSRTASRVTQESQRSADWPEAILRAAAPHVALLESDDERRWFWRGVGRTLATVTAQSEIAVRWGRLSAEHPTDVLRGLEHYGAGAVAVCEGFGFQLGLRASPYQPPEQALLARTAVVPERLREVLVRAVGWGYRVRFVEDEYFVPSELSFEDRLPEGVRGAFRAGLAHAGGPP
jgi:hypothetical protein